MLKKLCLTVCGALICLALAVGNNRPIFLDRASQIQTYLSNSSSGEIITLKEDNYFTFFGKIKGESYKADKQEFSLEDFLREFDGEILFVEKIGEGVSYYGKADKIKYRKIYNGEIINFHIFVGENSVTVGAPIIYGSF